MPLSLNSRNRQNGQLFIYASLAPTDLTPSDYVTRPLPNLDGYDQLLVTTTAALQETVS
jgi:hypothetical protein